MEVLLFIVLVIQAIGAIYFLENVNKLDNIKRITVGDVIMIIIAPIGLLIMLLVVGFIFLIMFIEPFWTKKIFKNKQSK